VSDSFYGLAGSTEPIVYTAQINTMNGQSSIPQTQISPVQASIMVSPELAYFTVEVDPTAVDWSNGLAEVIVTVTPTSGTANLIASVLTFPANASAPQYVTWPVTLVSGQPVSVTYTWTATYTTPNQTPAATPVVTSSTELVSLPPSP
jgi:hypothetical protein